MSRSGLKAFQQRMAAAVMAPATRRGTLPRRRADGVRMDAEAAAFVKPNDRLSSLERLEIYHQQYWLRVLGSLAEDFPGLGAVLGRSRFDRLARAYLAECPSRSFTLRNLGSRLPDWLDAHPAWTAPRSGLALDTARLEWAHIEAFDAASGPLPDAGDLALLAEDTRLHLQPHLRLLRLDYPVHRVLVRLRQELAGASGNHALAAARPRALRRIPDCAPESTFLAVHRHDLTVYYKPLDPEAFRILEAIGAGASLGEAIEAGFRASAMPEAERPPFLHQAFHDWASFGWFTRSRPSPHGDPDA